MPDSPGFHFFSALDYANAYRHGDPEPRGSGQSEFWMPSNPVTPVQSPLNAIIAVNREDVIEQAAWSAERIKARKPLSILDGVPVAVKDELDMQGYPTTVGTRFLGRLNSPG